MSSLFVCNAFENIEGNIYVDKDVVNLNMNSKSIELHLSLNPMQVKGLVEALQNVMQNVKVASLTCSDIYGDFTLNIENNKGDMEENENASN